MTVDGELTSVPFLSAVQHGEPTRPTDAPSLDSSVRYSGTWEGTISDSVAGAGTIRVVLSETGASILGTWEATFATGRTGGTLTGLIQSSGVFLEITPSDPTACPFRSVAQYSGRTLSGTYVALDCTVPVSGALSISKR